MKVRPRVLVESWEDEGMYWVGVRFGYPAGSEPSNPDEITMMLKEMLVNATASH